MPSAQMDAWKARLDELQKRVHDLRAQLAQVEEELEAHEAAVPVIQDAQESQLSPDGKIQLFRRLFIGRDDVYARRWENQKSGKAGYAPACANEWIRGVCEKPRVKCAQCLQRQFLPLDDAVIKAHLQGKKVVGVYPLNSVNETIFLAADFDGESWQRDVKAVVRAARELSVPFVLERSRSGDGAHVWIFFEEHVPAFRARLLGFHLLSHAMNYEHRLPLTSYDRLFPNQDAMPDGGFGNLIALPLQYQARARGNTLFLDDELNLIADPWAFLESVKKVTAAQLNAWVGSLEPKPCKMEDEESEETPPWLRSPSRTRKAPVLKEKPVRLKVIRGQSLFIEREGLSSPLLARCKRLAVISNPEFHRRQALRLSVSGTPRLVQCFEDEDSWLSLPRGCEDDLTQLAAELEIPLEWEDQLQDGEVFETEFVGTLRPGQQDAVDAMAAHRLGVLCAPPGAGKTVMASALIARHGRNTLILVHRQPLLEQWKLRLSTFLGLASKDIGIVGGGKDRRNGRLDIAMIQSLVRDTQVADWVAGYGQVVIDECHHVPAVSVEKVLKEVKARRVYGLTATPRRKDGLQKILYFQCGPIRYQIKETAASSELEKILEIRETGVAPPEQEGSGGIQLQFGALAAHSGRTRKIADDVAQLVRTGSHPLVLTERIEHLEALEQALKEQVENLVVLKGGGSAKTRKARTALLLSLGPDDSWAILATGRYIGEGFDESRLDTLVLAMPMSWKGTLVQYAGRIMREHEGKKQVRIVDYADEGKLLLSMLRKRQRVWAALGFKAGTKFSN